MFNIYDNGPSLCMLIFVAYGTLQRITDLQRRSGDNIWKYYMKSRKQNQE